VNSGWTGAGVGAYCGCAGAAAAAPANAAAGVPSDSIPNTVRHTEQRARTPPGGTFAGSMRKTV
jgi:hypothetical protein